MFKEEYKEINLIDYIKVISKRWKLILGITLACILAVLLGSVYSGSIYGVSSAIEIGSFGGDPIESTDSLVSKIKEDVYGVRAREELSLAENQYLGPKAFSPEKSNLILLEIATRHSNTENAQKILNKLSELILYDHEQIIEMHKTFLNQEKEGLESKIKMLEKEKETLETRVATLEKIGLYQQSSTFQLSFLDAKSQLGDKNEELETYFRQLRETQSALASIQSTQIIKQPYVSESPVAILSLKMKMIVSIALGLFVGILAAFSAEYWKKNKKFFKG